MEPESSRPYPAAFLHLQLKLAQKIADLVPEPLDEFILRFTALYSILGLDWSFDSANPSSPEHLEGIARVLHLYRKV